MQERAPESPDGLVFIGFRTPKGWYVVAMGVNPWTGVPRSSFWNPNGVVRVRAGGFCEWANRETADMRSRAAPFGALGT